MQPVHKQVQYLLLKGLTPEGVQEVLDLTPTAYQHAVAKIVKGQIDANYAQQVLQLELDRLDIMQQKYFDGAVDGNLDCLQAMLAIMKRRAAYLGLDAPTIVSPTAAGSFMDVLASFNHPVKAIEHAEGQQSSDPHQLN